MDTKQKELLKQLAQMGDVILVQEGGKRIKLNDDAEISLATQLDAVLYFMQRMDENMLKLILEDCYTYQDYDKKTFLRSLLDAFEEFQEYGNTYLNVFEGKCNSCVSKKMNCQGYSFLGNQTNHYMDLIFEITDDKVSDIYECFDLVGEDERVVKRFKINIDNLNFPF